MDFKNKVALVTGGSGDLGLAIASEFVRQGADVAIASSSKEKLEAAKVELSAHGAGRVLALQRDLKQLDAAQSAVDEVIAKLGKLDVLVTCAGNFKRGTLFSLSDHDWHDGFELMFHGAVRATRAAWPHLKKNKGNVVFVSGVHGVTPHAISALGGTICASLINFNKMVAEIGVADGVRANCVVPGWIESTRLITRVDAIAKEQGISKDAAKQGMLKEMQMVRFGTPQDVANLVAFLASERGSYVHGQAYVLDGGLTKSL